MTVPGSEQARGLRGGLETEMREAAKKFEFEKAAGLRDTIKDLREKELLSRGCYDF